MHESDPGDGAVLTALLAHNTWANQKLLAFCRGLSDAQLDAAVVGGFGSIRDTLPHIIEAEVSYVERVNGHKPHNPAAPERLPWLDWLEHQARWAGDELLQLALAARADTRVRQRPPRQPIAYSLANLIAQSLGHSTEHRTQIATIITQLGLEPPDMSGWAYMEETGDLQEFGADDLGRHAL